ncbi:MAG: hypothetical protein V1839_00895 [archaeon]
MALAILGTSGNASNFYSGALKKSVTLGKPMLSGGSGESGGITYPGTQPKATLNKVPENSEATCSDKYDNDWNGKTDCADPGCTGQVCNRILCPPTIAVVGTGRISICVGGACKYTTNDCHENPAVPPICLDGLDNDNDGLIDCYDPDCDTGVAQAVFACRDGIDNDMDGVNDCADPDCDQACRPQCQFGKELNCIDGFDNDADGKTDIKDCDCPHIDLIPTGVTKTKTATGYNYNASVKNQGSYDENKKIYVYLNKTSGGDVNLGLCTINSIKFGTTDSCTISNSTDVSRVQIAISNFYDCDYTNNIATYDV